MVSQLLEPANNSMPLSHNCHQYITYNLNIRRPLPELERASLQLQSPMPSNPASPKPSNPDTPPGIQASRHPSIPDCRNPLFDYLKGVTAGPSRGPQGISGRQSSSPPLTPPGPQIGAPACTGVPNSSFDKHPSIQASTPRVTEVGGRGGSL